jgi:hypothetical protein
MRLRARPARLSADGGRRAQLSSAKPKLLLASPMAATFSGYRRRTDAGPEIGSTRTMSVLSFTAPDFRHATLPRPPRLAFGLEKAASATRKRNKDDGADEIQTNSARHARTVR